MLSRLDHCVLFWIESRHTIEKICTITDAP